MSFGLREEEAPHCNQRKSAINHGGKNDARNLEGERVKARKESAIAGRT
jgi:hypothetical protein